MDQTVSWRKTKTSMAFIKAHPNKYWKLEAFEEKRNLYNNKSFLDSVVTFIIHRPNLFTLE